MTEHLPLRILRSLHGRGKSCFRFLGLILICIAWIGCTAAFRPMGKGLAGGAADGLLTKADTLSESLGGGLVRGARDTLTSTYTNERLRVIIDSVGNGLTRELGDARDTLLGVKLHKQVADLRDALIGNKTQREVDSLMEIVMGDRTKVRFKALLAEALGDTTRAKIALLRNDLLGKETYAALDSMVAHMLATAADGYKTKFQPLLRQDGNFVTRNAKMLLVFGGIVTALLLGLGAFLFNRSRKYKRLIELLTLQIHRTPDQPAHRDLINRIQYEARKSKLEPGLRTILKGQGIDADGTDIPHRPGLVASAFVTNK